VSKKLWIRLVGLLSLFAWAVTAILFWAGLMAPDATTKSNVSILVAMSFVGAGLVTFLWTVLSLVAKLDHQAPAKAKAG